MRIMACFALVFLALSFVSSPLQADTDIAWIELRPDFHYRDIGMFCSNNVSTARGLFSAEITDGQVTMARFHYNQVSDTVPSRKFIELEPEELEGIGVRMDEGGQHWLTSIPMNERILTWHFFHSSGFLESCEPPQELIEINPNTVTYQFERGIGGMLLRSKSQNISFEGHRKDGGYFEARLGFTQKPYVPFR